jgi:hypothetical protein
MEITAVIKALEFASRTSPDAHIVIHSDSNLVINTVTKNWKRRENTDLWDVLFTLLKKLDVTFHKVRAHADNVLNNNVDLLARTAAEKIQTTNPVYSEPNNPSDNTIIHCSKCDYRGEGLVGWIQNANLIRVDCPTCRTFITFAGHTDELLQKAKKRPLLAEREQKRYLPLCRHVKPAISNKSIKTYTETEIRELIS